MELRKYLLIPTDTEYITITTICTSMSTPQINDIYYIGGKPD
jgi:hypothetical protein